MTKLDIVKADSRKGRKKLARLVKRGEEVVDRKTRKKAEKIVDSIRTGGDKALLKAAAKYDGTSVETVAALQLDPSGTDAGAPGMPAGFAEGLERSIAAVERYHQNQIAQGFTVEEAGMTLEERRIPLRRVGIYIPGGRAAYPSTAVMTVLPARMAGVDEIVVATPADAFRRSPALRYTLDRLNVREVWGIGGAQAVAAFAFGTETVRRVDKIVGPGNRWVTAAKQIVAGHVGLDNIAGPTEVVILATEDAPAELVAADLLAQAEHDPMAASILVTVSKAFAKEVAARLAEQIVELPPESVAPDSISRFGTAFIVPSLGDGVELVDRIAPEHLQLVGEGAEELAERPFLAGAVFVGAATPEVFGDYVAGPSHVLPTGGTARFASALGVEDFVRRSHVVSCEPGAASRWAAAAVAMAEAEGLPAHAASAVRRLR